MKVTVFILVIFLPFNICGQKVSRIKKEAIKLLEGNASQLFQISDSIWQYSEPSFKEFKTVKLIKKYLKKTGFEIEDSICGVPTMFIASFGSGKPVVGILAEYDADHPLVKKDVPFTLPESSFGHGAGHNLLGVGSLGGVLAIKEMIDKGKLKGTVRYYGSTAEGGLGGRVYMARDGYFDDIDLSVFWHPSPVNSVNLSKWDAIIDMEIKFSQSEKSLASEVNMITKTAAFLTELAEIKKQYNDQLILNFTLKSSYSVLYHQQDSLKMQVRIEHPDQMVALKILKDIQSLIKSFQTQIHVDHHIFRAVHEAIPNKKIQDVAFRNVKLLGPSVFSTLDETSAQKVYDYLEKKHKPLMSELLPYKPDAHEKTLYGYGSDIGDVSWFAPQLSFVTTCLPLGISMSNWEGTYFTGNTIGKKGMLYASKIMVLSLIDYYKNEGLREEIHQEYLERTKHYHYKPLIPPGVPNSEKNSKRSR